MTTTEADIELENEHLAASDEDDIELKAGKGAPSPEFLDKDKDDWVAEWLLKFYRKFFSDDFRSCRYTLYLAPIVAIAVFVTCISSSASNVIAFSAFIISLVFMVISFWMLGWILDKDTGTQAMKDIGDAIKEGSEGFFKTQYGTIFKLATLVALGLFLIYINRSPASVNKDISKYMSNTFMALVTAMSFLLGANCSALSGYAGIWVSVRANIRVAAAARKCYNETI